MVSWRSLNGGASTRLIALGGQELLAKQCRPAAKLGGHVSWFGARGALPRNNEPPLHRVCPDWSSAHSVPVYKVKGSRRAYLFLVMTS